MAHMPQQASDLAEKGGWQDSWQQGLGGRKAAMVQAGLRTLKSWQRLESLSVKLEGRGKNSGHLANVTLLLSVHE